MASWMIHLRVADILLSRIDGLFEMEFVVGNLAPDSGVPNADWSDFSPSPVISHFKAENNEGRVTTCPEKYIASHFTKEMQKSYTKEQFSFYLGYLVHLLTDVLWVKNTLPLCASKAPEEYNADPKGIVWKWKKDFFDLDALYLMENPDFRAFRIYEGAKGFVNEYLDIFSPDAFDQKREYIVNFYRQKRTDLYRDYVYFTKEEADRFVSFATEEIERMLEKYIKR